MAKAKTPAPAARKRVDRPYPRRPLEDALRVPTAIKEKNAGNPWAPDQVAKAMSVAPKSANFFYLTAAARDYGLSEGTRDTPTIALTPLGKRAVYPQDLQDERAARMTAFLNVSVFKKLLEYYKGNNLPDAQFLSNVLTTRFDLDEDVHTEFRDVFEKNCRFLGIGSTYNAETGSNTSLTAARDADDSASVTVAMPAKKSSGEAKTCFIIMPFTEREDKHPVGFFEEVLRSVLIPAISEAGFEARTAKRQGSDIIQATIVSELLAADLVVADLTEHNPNVLFELGMRMAEDRPVALVRAKGTGAIFDVDNMLRVEDYDPNLWTSTVALDVPTLTEHIRAAWDSRDSGATFRKILEQRRL